MGRFQDKRRGNDRGSNRFDRGDRGEKRMFQATCSNCGKVCEVPFEPRGDRPVFCRDCFKKQDSRDFRGGDHRGNDRGRSNFGDKKMFTATCDNCGNTCEVPFRPTGEKPVYCSNCFEKMGNKHDSRRPDQRPQTQPDFSNQLKAIHNKLDLILSTLIPAGKAPAEKKVAEKPAVKKAAKKVKSKKAAKK